MRKSITIASLCLAVLGYGCAKTGSTTTERNQAGNGTQSADTARPPAVAPPVADPVVPSVPIPPPSGWKAFDSYFESLLRVHELVVDTTRSLPASTIKELQSRAEALAKDTAASYRPSAELRKTLVDQIKLFAQAPNPNGKTNDQLMQAFRPVILSSGSVAQAPVQGGAGTQNYGDKINAMMLELDRAVIHMHQTKP